MVTGAGPRHGRGRLRAAAGTAARSGCGTCRVITYTPTRHWKGTDTFTYRIKDNAGNIGHRHGDGHRRHARVRTTSITDDGIGRDRRELVRQRLAGHRPDQGLLRDQLRPGHPAGVPDPSVRHRRGRSPGTPDSLHVTGLTNGNVYVGSVFFHYDDGTPQACGRTARRSTRSPGWVRVDTVWSEAGTTTPANNPGKIRVFWTNPSSSAGTTRRLVDVVLAGVAGLRRRQQAGRGAGRDPGRHPRRSRRARRTTSRVFARNTGGGYGQRRGAAIGAAACHQLRPGGGDGRGEREPQPVRPSSTRSTTTPTRTPATRRASAATRTPAHGTVACTLVQLSLHAHVRLRRDGLVHLHALRRALGDGDGHRQPHRGRHRATRSAAPTSTPPRSTSRCRSTSTTRRSTRTGDR